MVVFFFIAIIILPATGDSATYVIYPDAADLSTNFSLSTNVYGSSIPRSYSWTLWLQLSSMNSITSANLTILSLKSSQGILLSLFLCQGRYLAVNITTTLETVETFVISSEMPPLDQWFLAVFCVNPDLNQVKLAWRRSFGQSTLSKIWTMMASPSNQLAVANLTLDKAVTAQGYLSLVLLWDAVLSDSEILWIAPPTNLHYTEGQMIGGTAFDASEALVLPCPRNDTVIQRIEFAAYGQPMGIFPNFQASLQCDSPTALSVIESICSGKRACLVPADKRLYGDPCPDFLKWISVKAWCSIPAITTRARFSQATPRTNASPSRPQLVQAPAFEKPPGLGNSDYGESQNGYRVKLGLNLDIAPRSQTQNRIDARLAVRQISMALAVSLDRFVLIDLYCLNQTNTILTFTVLSGSTSSSLNDGLNIVRYFGAEIQRPDSELRESSLLHTVPTTSIFIELECIPLMLCPSGEYVCKTESSCQSPPSPMSTLSTSVNLSGGIGVAVIAVIGVVFFWRRYKSRNSAKGLATSRGLMVSATANDHKPHYINAGLDAFSGDIELSAPKEDAAEFRLPGARGHGNSLTVGTSGTHTMPQGVASTLSDLEHTFASINHQ